MKTHAHSCCQRFVLTSILLSSGLLSAPAQNLLLDPSFDHPNQTSPWTFFGGAESLERVPNRTPSEAYDTKRSLQAPADIQGTSSGAMQIVPATSGGQMTFSGYVLNSIHNELRPGCYGLSRIEFLSAAGDSLGAVESQRLARATGGWVPFSIQGIAPEGTSEARLSVLLWKGPITDAYGALYFDSLNVQEITSAPEPHVCLVALGVIAGAVLVRRRTEAR